MGAGLTRLLQLLCIIGVVGCLALAVWIAFIRSEDVSDTRCYPILWQRNGREICEASNRRRELQLTASVVVGLGLGITTVKLQRRPPRGRSAE